MNDKINNNKKVLNNIIAIVIFIIIYFASGPIYSIFYSILKNVDSVREKISISNKQEIRNIENKVQQYLKETYPNETFKLQIYKKTKLNSEICKFAIDSCLSYEKVPGKYTYYFKAYDSKNLEFEISYDEEYENHEEEYNENYKSINTRKVVSDYLVYQTKQILDEYDIKYDVGTANYDGETSYEIKYDFPISLYMVNMDNIDVIINKISTIITKEKKLDNEYILDNKISISIYILNNFEIFNKLKSNFENLEMCEFNEEGYFGDYVCNEKTLDNSKINKLINYIIIENQYGGGSIIGPDEYSIIPVDKDNN